jgi:peroxiredoxin
MEHPTPLTVGDMAPDFSLAAANRDGLFVLNDCLRKGPAIVEFLRGTW